jgi:flagellar motor switch protein FliN
MAAPPDNHHESRPNADELKALLNNSQKPAAEPTTGRGLEFLYDIPLQISVEVGRSKVLLRDLLKIGEGYVIELDKLAGEPLDLYINSRLIAHGEAVKVGDKFGIRLTDVVNTSDHINTIGR